MCPQTELRLSYPLSDEEMVWQPEVIVPVMQGVTASSSTSNSEKEPSNSSHKQAGYY